MSTASLGAIGFLDAVTSLIEVTYANNLFQRLVLIGHSNGGSTIYSFLVSKDFAWKQKYIAGIIALSGNYLGQMNAYETFITYDSAGSARQRCTTSWEASFMSAPYGEFEQVNEIPVVTTNAGTSQEKNFTSRLEDMASLFTTAGHADWSDKLTAVYPFMNR
jgi:uncharacterized alpha/beta hydrolase family protein